MADRVQNSNKDDEFYRYLRAAVKKAQRKARAKAKRPPKPVVVYEPRVVCWIDILGFGKAVRETLDADGRIIQEKVDRIARAINRMREHVSMPKEFRSARPKSMRAEQFSDSILISFHISPSQILETLIDVELIIIDLIMMGFPARGYVSYGQMVHTKDMFFGPAFLDAYEGEKLAIFPRVIVDERMVILMKQNLRHDTDIVRSVTKNDEDGLWYIDYFGGAEGAVDNQYAAAQYYDALRRLIQDGLKIRDRRTRQKYAWMRTKYNQMLRLFKYNIRNSSSHPAPELEAFYLKQNLIR